MIKDLSISFKWIKRNSNISISFVKLYCLSNSVLITCK